MSLVRFWRARHPLDRIAFAAVALTAAAGLALEAAGYAGVVLLYGAACFVVGWVAGEAARRFYRPPPPAP